MEATSTLSRTTPLEYAQRINWSAVSTWLLGFVLVVYLGLKGGGFDPLVHDQVGIAVWWVLLGAVLVGALPRRQLSPLAWTALGLLAAFVIWTALSLTWTESAERTSGELARVLTYLGVFALALFIRDRKGARRMVAAVGTGIAFVSLIALLSRLHPTWFPEAAQTSEFLSNSRERLSYPLNYWNALAALIAMGLPLMLQVATCAKQTLFRSLAAATLPAMALTCFLTLSRGGIAAAIIALAVFLAFTSDRLPKLLTLLVTGSGGAILIVAALQRNALQEGLLNSAAREQGNEILAMTLVVCAGVGLIQAGISIGLAQGLRPRWTIPSRRLALGLATGGAIVALVAAAAFDAPSRASDAWAEFKDGGNPSSGTERLGSFAGESRYRLWAAAVRQEETRPLTGTGAATFKYWWPRDGDTEEFVEDTHSLYMQVLGELGIVGFILLLAFLFAVIGGGVWKTMRAGSRGQPQLAAALAGCAALCITFAFEWTWQVPVLPVVFLLIASAIFGTGNRSRRKTAPGLQFPLRIAFVPVAIAAVVAIAIPLASTTSIRQSQAEAQAGNLTSALNAARTAQNTQPGAATPRLQQALLYEGQGNLPLAAEAARAATQREPTNWRTWLTLSRIEARQGHSQPALHHYRRARSLNPNSSLFPD